MRVLVVTGAYLPGYRFGGPVRSLSAIVEQLGDDIEFLVATSNRDLGSDTPYADIASDTWIRVGNASVWYASGSLRSMRFWRRIIAETRPDVLYLNSFFDPTTGVLLAMRRMRLIPRIPILLAPRGEFSAGALAQKAPKKRRYLLAARRLAQLRDIHWHVSTSVEAEELLTAIPEAGDSWIVAPNLIAFGLKTGRTRPKAEGEVSFLHLARISPKKNLLGALELLMDVPGSVSIDVYGPIEDEGYWHRCLEAVERLPANVTFTYRGELEHQEVARVMRTYHFLLFPTLGENFGHSIAEALRAGLPVLISDQTPWRDLAQAGVGWDLGLDQHDQWAQAVADCVAMSDADYAAMSARCPSFVTRWLEQHGGRAANLRMFQRVVARSTMEARTLGTP